MRSYFSSIWACRFFWLYLVVNDIQLRYRRSLLGIGWSLLHPLATALVTGVVFHEIFRVPIREFLPYILTGLACWAFVLGSVVQGCQSYIQAESYIRQHPLPLAIYPLRTTLGALVHFLIALVVVLILTWALRGPRDVRALTMLAPGVLLLFVFGWAAATLAGFVNVVFRDTQHILDVAFQVLFYLTPIIYPAELLNNHSLGWLQRFNPLVPFLALIRGPLLDGQIPAASHYLTASVIAFVALAAALGSLGYQQRRVIFYL